MPPPPVPARRGEPSAAVVAVAVAAVLTVAVAAALTAATATAVTGTAGRRRARCAGTGDIVTSCVKPVRASVRGPIVAAGHLHTGGVESPQALSCVSIAYQP
ncbi:hypothetical protein ACFW9V_35950 [Streptomyces hygroscopicus]|uniref:hypothetical protein n=1 Tax=Streptomyces TaxID=1883 RepID=UPI0025B0A41E|nr:hypothetical protein [Streptomyces sp. SRF1]MDN3060941.1 hypothetical protein [Streptomyces sp. SRF1]